jgi:hypothetical protein
MENVVPRAAMTCKPAAMAAVHDEQAFTVNDNDMLSPLPAP